jgi:ribosomal protein L7/L12
MQVTFAISMQEANAILSEHFAVRHGMMRTEIKVVIGDVDHVQNIQNATIKMRSDLIKRIEILLGSNSKISAIKEFRQLNQDSDLKQARYFVENPSMWEHYINTGEYK